MNHEAKLILVDDDQELCELLSNWLRLEGFTTMCCHDAKTLWTTLPDFPAEAIVLDVTLPDVNGLEVLRKLRKEYPRIPVLMLSARGESLDRILGLELGADDYMPKPCDPRELTARLRAVLRRANSGSMQTVTTVSDITLNMLRGAAYIDDQEIQLTMTEARLLSLLLENANDPVDRDQLAEYALGRKLHPYDRSIDVHISNLRKKLGPSARGASRIASLRKRGYVYRSPR